MDSETAGDYRNATASYTSTWNSKYTAGRLAARAELAYLRTGSAGELAYSTKPTIFYYATSSAALGGYQSPTASLQFNRHTYPYTTPFYLTN